MSNSRADRDRLVVEEVVHPTPLMAKVENWAGVLVLARLADRAERKLEFFDPGRYVGPQPRT